MIIVVSWFYFPPRRYSPAMLCRWRFFVEVFADLSRWWMLELGGLLFVISGCSSAIVSGRGGSLADSGFYIGLPLSQEQEKGAECGDGASGIFVGRRQFHLPIQPKNFALVQEGKPWLFFAERV
jgi:hypothetical protein